MACEWGVSELSDVVQHLGCGSSTESNSSAISRMLAVGRGGAARWYGGARRPSRLSPPKPFARLAPAPAAKASGWPLCAAPPCWRSLEEARLLALPALRPAGDASAALRSLEEGGELLRHRLALHVQAVVLVGRLGDDGARRLGGARLADGLHDVVSLHLVVEVGLDELERVEQRVGPRAPDLLVRLVLAHALGGRAAAAAAAQARLGGERRG